MPDRVLGKNWGLHKVGSSYCADRKTEVQRSCPRIQNYTQWQRATLRAWPTALLPPPQTLCTGCAGLQGKGGGGALKGHGEVCWDLEGSLVKLRVLALSPLRPKKKLMRLQGQRSRAETSGGLNFPSCIKAVRISVGWAPQWLFTPSPSAACWVMGWEERVLTHLATCHIWLCYSQGEPLAKPRELLGGNGNALNTVSMFKSMRSQ